MFPGDAVVQVPRTVLEDVPHADLDDRVGTDELTGPRRVGVDGGVSVDTQLHRPFGVDEQQSHRRVDPDVSEAAEHSVAVVAGKAEALPVGHPHETWKSPLV
jgi:hypothetical protein